MAEGTIVRLATKDWLWLISMIVGGAVANVAMVHSQSAHTKRQVQERMDQLDDRWQQRTLLMAQDIKSDIHAVQQDVKDVKKSIPPAWFLDQVKRLEVIVEKQAGEIASLREQLAKLKGPL